MFKYPVKLISKVLLALFLFQSLALVCIWNLRVNQIHAARWELKKSVKFSELELSNWAWEKARLNEHEILFNGKHYDIQFLEWKDDKTVLLHVTSDTDEDEVWESITSFFGESRKSNSIPSNAITAFFAFLFFEKQTFCIVEPTRAFIVIGHLANADSQTVALRVPTPPPDHAI